MNLSELKKLFEKWSAENIICTEKLPESGSNRGYYRLKSNTKTAIGVINTDKNENIAFLDFSEKLKNCGINVPDIYITDLENNIYIQQDLGDNTLYNYINKKNTFDNDTINIYKKVLSQLLEMQIKVADKINYSLCYPRPAFDRQSIQWDLNYFKYYFLKLADIPFNEQLLENDFDKLINLLLKTDTNYFLFRDFQSRNIMLHNEKIYFIDYQGGRKGALHYDVASLLYDAKANLNNELREELLTFYIKKLNNYKKTDNKEFKQTYYLYALIRIMQAMGTFGFRGFFERKTHFLESIPYALKNIDFLLKSVNFNGQIPYLNSVLKKLQESKKLNAISKNQIT